LLWGDIDPPPLTIPLEEGEGIPIDDDDDDEMGEGLRARSPPPELTDVAVPTTGRHES